MLFGGSGPGSAEFNPSEDIGSLAGKVVLVTGGNAGLGKETVLEYARHQPREIWLACRDTAKGDEVVTEIKKQYEQQQQSQQQGDATTTAPPPPVKILELDLSRFASVKKAAARVLAETDRLDILVLNAGVMALPPGLTEDGYEVQFGTNHMGHALLTKLLLPLLTRTASSGGGKNDVRVVSLSSYGHMQVVRGAPHWHLMKTTAEELGSFGRYAESKLANALWARQLAREHPELTVAAVHPGLVQTQLMTKAEGTSSILRGIVSIVGPWLVNSAAQGARNQLWASVSPDVRSGEYYEPVGRGGNASDLAKSDERAQELWDWTEQELQGQA